MLKNLRANEQVYLISPPNVEYRILGPEAGNSAGANSIRMIDHHDTMIARNVLAGFLTLGRDARGTQAYGARLTDFFVSALYGVARGIAGDLKAGIVKQLCNLNFEMAGREYPSIVVRDLERQDLERVLALVLKAVGTLLTPDDSLEDYLRSALKLPPRPEGVPRRRYQRRR